LDFGEKDCRKSSAAVHKALKVPAIQTYLSETPKEDIFNSWTYYAKLLEIPSKAAKL